MDGERRGAGREAGGSVPWGAFFDTPAVAERGDGRLTPLPPALVGFGGGGGGGACGRGGAARGRAAPAPRLPASPPADPSGLCRAAPRPASGVAWSLAGCGGGLHTAGRYLRSGRSGQWDPPPRRLHPAHGLQQDAIPAPVAETSSVLRRTGLSRCDPRRPASSLPRHDPLAAPPPNPSTGRLLRCILCRDMPAARFFPRAWRALWERRPTFARLAGSSMVLGQDPELSN